MSDFGIRMTGPLNTARYVQGASPPWEDPSIQSHEPRPPIVGHLRQARTEPATASRGVGDLTIGDHVRHGTTSMVLPSVLAGALTGAIASSRAPMGKGVAFSTYFALTALGGIASGAAMGLLAGATTPEDGDNLTARYAIAGGLVGLASGAVFPAGMSRPVSAIISGVSNAVMGGIIGHDLQRRTEHEQRQRPPHPATLEPGLSA